MLSEKLIENALAITGKSMEDMEVVSGVIYQKEELTYRFSIEKFCYYLLSPEFIGKYAQKGLGLGKNTYTVSWFSMIIGQAITEYQSGNEQPLIELLSKIK